jgi:hypothetical protein
VHMPFGGAPSPKMVSLAVTQVRPGALVSAHALSLTQACPSFPELLVLPPSGRPPPVPAVLPPLPPMTLPEPP